MKKVLILSGIGLAGFAFYRYFKTQVSLAMNYHYTIKDFTLVGVEGDNVNVKVVIEIVNKSNFEVTINSFDLDLYYNDRKFATVVSNNLVKIKPNSAFRIEVFGTINKSNIKESLPAFISSVLARKPIDVVINGVMKLTLMNIDSTLRFDKQKVNYSADFAKDWGFSDALDKIKSQFPKLFQSFEKNK